MHFSSVSLIPGELKHQNILKPISVIEAYAYVSRLYLSGTEATLKPLYKTFEDACEKNDPQIAIDLYHPQAVIVKKNEHALYKDGKQIMSMYRHS